MKHPKRFPFVVNCAFSVITAVYISVAAIGYAGWGQTMQGGSGNVLDFAAASCDHCVIVAIAYVMISLHVFLAIPVPLNPLNLYVGDVCVCVCCRCNLGDAMRF
jgi:Transmembrane amino acid transporter protein